jgi:glutamine amidotransferase
MQKKVLILDYQLGNLYSVKQACAHVGIDAAVSSDKDALLEADGIILPGVGAFKEAMDHLHRLDLVAPLKDFVQQGKPLFGVCLGMQLLFSESTEFGVTKGLDLISGEINKFASPERIRVPQIGWNRIFPNQDRWEGSPLQNCNEGEYMYFVHSYYALPANPEDALSNTVYEGIEYCSAVEKDNIFATQFHPEKSGIKGLEIYHNWAKNNFNLYNEPENKL